MFVRECEKLKLIVNLSVYAGSRVRLLIPIITYSPRVRNSSDLSHRLVIILLA